MSRTVLLLTSTAVAALVSVLASGLALAQATTEHISETVPLVDITFDNPCTGEPMEVTGEVHITGNVTFDAEGGVHGIFTERFNDVKATGVESGEEYVVTQVIQFNNNARQFGGFPPAEETGTSSLLFTSKGSSDDFLAHFTFHITVNSNGELTSTVAVAKVECKG